MVSKESFQTAVNGSRDSICHSSFICYSFNTHWIFMMCLALFQMLGIRQYAQQGHYPPRLHVVVRVCVIGEEADY